MYDEAGFPVANPINRFAIGDRDQLKFNADGSLDLYIQHDSPGSDKESNWLPGPASGTLAITLRLYAPRPAALYGRWAPPAVQRVEGVIQNRCRNSWRQKLSDLTVAEFPATHLEVGR
jgi:hypothetical protein